LIENSEIPYTSKKSKNGECDSKFNTGDVLFICSGAFEGLKEFSTMSLIDFGMMPEFMGRFSSICELKKLEKEDYIEILKNSKDSILNTFKDWFKGEDSELIVKDDAIDYIADKAIEADVTWLFDFEDVPPAIQLYITARAARMAANKMVGDTGLFQLLQEQEVQTKAAAIEYDCNQADYSIFGWHDGENYYNNYQPYNALIR